MRNFILLPILRMVWPLYICYEPVYCLTTFPLALNYLKSRSVTSVNSFFCHDEELKKAFLLGRLKEQLIIVKLSHFIQRTDSLKCLQAQRYVNGIIIDLNCQSSFNLFNLIAKGHFFNASFAITLLTEYATEHTLRFLEESNIAFDSDVTLFADNKLYDVHRVAKFEPLVSLEIGRWSSEEIMEVDLKPMRWDVKGVTLVATTVVKNFRKDLFGTEEFFDGRYFGSVDQLSRYACALHRYLEFLNNFKTNITTSPDWGYYNRSTGKFDPGSMYGALEQGLIDFGLAFSWMYEERVRVVHFAPSVNNLRSCIAFRHPPSGASIQALVLPLSSTTWLVLMLAVFTASVCLYIMRRWLNDDNPGEVELSNSVLQVIGVLCLQGSYIESSKISTRILSLFIQVMALMIFTYYDAKIIGFLLLPTPRTITTVEKLLESNMDLWVENISFHKHHFDADYSPEATKYYERGIKGQLAGKDKFIDRIQGLSLVEKGGTALYGVTPALFENIPKMYTSSEICSLHYLNTVIMQTASPVKKTSPYREMYDKGLLRIVESGIRDYEDKKWHAQKPACVGTEANAAVTLEATFIAQVIYAFGFILALIFLVCEKIVPPKNVKVQKLKPFPIE